MKKLTRLFAVLLALAMVMSLIACQQKPEDMIEKSIKSTAAIKSYDAHMDIDLSIGMKEIQEESITMDIDVDMTCFADPLKAMMTMRMELMGMPVTTLMYMDTINVYMSQGESWIKTPLGSAAAASQANSANIQSNFDMYLKNIENFELIGEEKVGDHDTYKLEGFLSGTSIKDAIEASGIASQMAVDPQTLIQMESMFAELDDVPLTIWVDQKSYIAIQVYYDMTLVAQKMFQNMSDQQDGDSMLGFDTIVVDKYTAMTTISNIDKAEDFEIPPEALAATMAN